MDRFARIAVLENEFEAGLIDTILIEQDIPHVIRSYHDSALDGLFQAQKGWGCIEAAEEYKAAILELLDDLRSEAAAREDTFVDEQDDEQ